jgi:NHS family xanthosine MFS transporter
VLPNTPPKGKSSDALGTDAFVLFRNRSYLIFFIAAILVCIPLSFYYGFANKFLNEVNFSNPAGKMTLGQVSEAVFILAIPFFLQKFGIKKIMLMSILAWVLRFALFGIGNPGEGLHWLVLSMIIYGMAFDFFNISGSLFVEKEADVSIRASAQGLFMLMTNGIGAYLGGTLSGMVVDYFTQNGVKNWPSIWFSFAGYALVLAILFPIVFKYNHNEAKQAAIKEY